MKRVPHNSLAGELPTEDPAEILFSVAPRVRVATFVCVKAWLYPGLKTAMGMQVASQSLRCYINLRLRWTALRCAVLMRVLGLLVRRLDCAIRYGHSVSACLSNWLRGGGLTAACATGSHCSCTQQRNAGLPCTAQSTDILPAMFRRSQDDYICVASSR